MHDDAKWKKLMAMIHLYGSEFGIIIVEPLLELFEPVQHDILRHNNQHPLHVILDFRMQHYGV